MGPNSKQLKMAAGIEMHFPDLKNNAHCVIKDSNVCKITDVKLSRPGKHGHAKYFTMASETYTLCAITDDDYLELMDNDGEIISNIALPDSDSLDAKLGTQIREIYDDGEQVCYTTVLTIAIGKPDDADYKEGTRITNVLAQDD